MLWGSGAIFLILLVCTEENKSVKEFVHFSTTDVFVPVSQLSTRDLFYFLENLKIRQDILSWVSRLVRSLDQRVLWFPYSRLFFGIVFKKMLILECLGCFTKSIVVSILDFWHISFRKMFWICWLVKEIITLNFGRHVKRLKIVIMVCGSFSLSVFGEKSPYRVGHHVGNVFYLKDFVTWQVCKMLSDISLGGLFTLLFATTTLVAM